MRLGLGTAQFGIPYGATNVTGQVPPAEAQAIVRLALRRNIDLFDSAPAYGTAEEVIGSVLPAEARVITKTSIARRDHRGSEDIAAIKSAFVQSLTRLQRRQVYGLLVHSPDDLLGPDGDLIVELLLELRAAGLAQKIGVSIYTQAQIEYCMRRYSLDLYQVPLSYIDQRLVRSGVLRDLANTGAEIHARGIFLQGVLLAPVDTLPAYFDPWRDRLLRIRRALRDASVAPAAAALAFVRSNTAASYAIVGVTSESDLRQLLEHEAMDAGALPFDQFAIDDVRLLDPSGWPAMRS
jgi:aryl-alcohol dehydrogenase-like predicted oxidoreductase